MSSASPIGSASTGSRQPVPGGTTSAVSSAPSPLNTGSISESRAISPAAQDFRPQPRSRLRLRAHFRTRRPLELALLAQRVENEFVGVQCGIMDQLTVAIAKANHALVLDCRDLTTRYVPIPDGWRSSFATAEWNGDLRHRATTSVGSACQKAARMIGVDSLRDASLRQIEDLPYPLRRRARHVVTENQRTIAAAEALLVNDVAALGELMDDSHRSMRDDFEIVPSRTRRSRCCGSGCPRVFRCKADRRRDSAARPSTLSSRRSRGRPDHGRGARSRRIPLPRSTGRRNHGPLTTSEKGVNGAMARRTSPE